MLILRAITRKVLIQQQRINVCDRSVAGETSTVFQGVGYDPVHPVPGPSPTASKVVLSPRNRPPEGPAAQYCLIRATMCPRGRDTDHDQACGTQYDADSPVCKGFACRSLYSPGRRDRSRAPFVAAKRGDGTGRHPRRLPAGAGRWRWGGNAERDRDKGVAGTIA